MGFQSFIPFKTLSDKPNIQITSAKLRKDNDTVTERELLKLIAGKVASAETKFF